MHLSARPSHWWFAWLQATLEMVGQIEQRNTEMAELERSLLDLHQIFLDMSVLVAGQSEMLDKIEGWVRTPLCCNPARFGCS